MKFTTYAVAGLVMAAAASSSSLRGMDKTIGMPSLVMKSMEYVISSSTEQEKSTEEALKAKTMQFNNRVGDERKVVEKTERVVKSAKACVADAQKRIVAAEAQINSTLAQKVPALKLSTARHGAESAASHVSAAQKEFDGEEATFKHDMLHLESVKNESTRVINLMNRHFLAKEAQRAGKGLTLKNSLVEQDKMNDLLPGHNHVRTGVKKESHKAIHVTKGDAANMAFLLETAAKHGLGEYQGLARALRAAAKPGLTEEMKQGTTKVPVSKVAAKSPKFHARTPADVVDANINKTQTAEPDLPEVGAGAGTNLTDTSESPAGAAGKMKIKALGNSVKVGKDVGGHVIAAVTKLHGFASEHAKARNAVFELGTKQVRKDLQHSKEEHARLVALVNEWETTNKKLDAQVRDLKENIAENEKQIKACQVDEEKANAGKKDAETKIGQVMADLKQLTEAYGTISKDLVHEKKVASYVLNLLKQKISKLKKFLAAAKLDAEKKQDQLAQNFTDPELPVYHGMPDALKCDPNSSPEEWCKTPEMMVRCGVTKESCETYHFKNKAFPENVVPVDPTGKGNSKEWAAMGPTKGKKGDPSVVDIRNTNDLKSDGTLRVGAL
jgi:hypothetical protein